MPGTREVRQMELRNATRSTRAVQGLRTLFLLFGTDAVVSYSAKLLTPPAQTLAATNAEVSPKLEVRPSLIPDAGRGVFTLDKVKKGALVERSDVIELGVVPSFMSNYHFHDPFDTNTSLIALGTGSLYNHAGNRSNVGYDVTNEVNKKIEFRALRDIQPGEELFIDYGYEPGARAVDAREHDVEMMQYLGVCAAPQTRPAVARLVPPAPLSHVECLPTRARRAAISAGARRMHHILKKTRMVRQDGRTQSATLQESKSLAVPIQRLPMFMATVSGNGNRLVLHHMEL